MDNILIVIAGVAFFLFRTYMNYKKEQEEASTRNTSVPQKRPHDARPVEKESHHPTEIPMEIPKWLEEFLPQQPEAKPQPVLVSSEPRPLPSNEHQGSISYDPVKYERVKYVPSELPADLLKEYRNLPEKREIDEVKRSAVIRAAHSSQHTRLKPLFVEDDDTEITIEVPSFDLRQAVIMNAILERPYK